MEVSFWDTTYYKDGNTVEKDLALPCEYAKY